MSSELAIHGGHSVRTRAWPRWPEFGAEEREALTRVLDSGNWGGFPSPNTEARAFSGEFSQYIGTQYAVPCANGTFSLSLALQAARIQPGAEVITTAYTFVGTAGGIIGAGAVPVFVDIDPDTYCIDCDQVEAAIGPRTEALMPVHLACSMADMDRLSDLAQRRGLLLVEDCAHSHGAQWRGRGAGSIGDLGSFSMQSSKLLTAGEGGAVTTNDEVLAQRVNSLVNCGRKEVGYDGFPEQMLGYNLRMTEWQAAALRCQLVRLPNQHRRRQRGVEQLETALAEITGLEPLFRDERITQRTAYQFIVRYQADAFSGVPRDHLIHALRAEGVPCSGQFYAPLNEDPLLAADTRTNPLTRAGIDFSGLSFPRARHAAYEESIWLPHELFLGDESDVGDIAEAFAKLSRNAARLREQPPAGAPSRR
ncbi:MAG: DegT/DnrJ/EryC1/StrS family aminotransferase [bacterium]|nr:DegT/DnrJ/EryC1/StrS family aminotransferase [bacterium]